MTERSTTADRDAEPRILRERIRQEKLRGDIVRKVDKVIQACRGELTRDTPNVQREAFEGLEGRAERAIAERRSLEELRRIYEEATRAEGIIRAATRGVELARGPRVPQTDRYVPRPHRGPDFGRGSDIDRNINLSRDDDPGRGPSISR
jgi:hypothetical protein